MYIETIEECDICRMDKDRFEHFLIEHPRFMMNMIKVLSDRISGMSSLAQHLALGNLQDKILYILLKLSDQFPSKAVMSIAKSIFLSLIKKLRIWSGPPVRL